MKLIRKIAAVGTICLVFAGSAWQVAQGQQRTTSLFSSGCVTRGSMGDSQRDISIGRQVFTEIFYMTDLDSLITCRIRPAGSQPKFKTLRLAFGIADNRSANKPVDVNVYLDGNLADSRSLSVSEASLIILDVSKVSSVAIEIPNNNDHRGTRVSFIQALLEPISSTPGRR
ncbi:hypothetical protein [Limnofasciculus baicalensis]|uniref:Uncharacterized protein n=1 Tax=Limnofasciculus baicalensis BBK-W-15 TaxID=2699891 RepID=A0AAE3KP71_9CYAN|nr:hypothetical protein [Limnofasciculus baicalensis]MCP2730994.1 hypothetical protein [Limnofasciculus baicalensis BBK-W-15]